MAKAVDTATLDDDTIREAIEYISENLRDADRAELRASLGPDSDPFWTLFESWELSTRTWFIVDTSGLPIGIFGVARHIVDGVGVAWMMGTDGILKEARSVARQTPGYIAQMNELYPVLFANVDARNELSMAWLEWAGFKIGDADPAWGPENRLFLQYVKAR